jgi:hypothetical protein
MGCSAGYALINLCLSSLAWICTLQFDSALLHHHQHSPCPPCTPHQALLHSWLPTSLPPKLNILRFKLRFNSPRANLNSKVFDMTNQPNNIGIQLCPLARPESFGNPRSAFCFFILLMNCGFLCLSALIRWERKWMTLRLCSIDNIAIA